jgi:triacylglycerol lipase
MEINMKFQLKAKALCAAALAVAGLTAATSANAALFGAAKTKYPVVLVHGFLGFDNILSVVNYFYQIPGALRDEGAEVFIAQVNPSQTTAYRGEELNKQLDAWKAAAPWYKPIKKFNLIGHSHGGPTVRYSAATRSDIASVSSMSGTHYGSKVADGLLADNADNGQFDTLGTSGLKLLGWFTGSETYKDADLFIALNALSSSGAAEFNAKFPNGKSVEKAANGQYFYSYAGNVLETNGWDISDPILGIFKKYYGTEANDGLVSPREATWGKAISLNLAWNHLDEINQVLGAIGKGAPDPKAYYVTMVNRLKGKSL